MYEVTAGLQTHPIDFYEVSECIHAPDGYILIQGIPFSDVDRNLLCTHLSTRSLVLEA